MGARPRSFALVVVLGFVLGLGALVLLWRGARPRAAVSDPGLVAQAEAAPVELELAPAAAATSEVLREALVAEEHAAAPRATARTGAELLGRVVLPASARARGRMGDVRVFWTYERGVARSGSLATLPPVIPAADGSFRLRDLPIEVPLVLWANAPFAPDWGRALVPFAGGETRELVVALEPWVTVRGHVVDEQSRPLAGVRISASRQTLVDPEERGGPRSGKLTRQSAADGSFELELSRAAWLLSFEGTLLGGDPLVDARAGDVRGLAYVLEKEACLRIELRWPDGTPARVRSFLVGEGTRTEFDEHGVVTFCGLKPGVHEYAFFDDRDNERGIVTARVSVPETTSLELVLHPPRNFDVVGTVLDSEGRAVPGAVVHARVGDLGDKQAQAGDGRFVLADLEEGRWTLWVVAEGLHSQSRTVLVDDVTPPQEFVLERATLVEGRVLDDEGRPVVGANVRILEPRVPVTAGGTSNDAGRFRLQLALDEPRALSLIASASGHTNSLPVELDVAPGERVEGVLLSLRPATSLLVRVRASDGRAIEDAELSLVGRVARFATDAAGESELTGLPLGEFQLRVQAAGFRLVEQPVVLALGPPQRIELTLTRIGSAR